MARYFAISAPEGLSKLALDSQGNATLQFKVKNVSGSRKDAHATVVPLPVTNASTPAVHKAWIKIDGLTDQPFEKDQEKVVVVKIAVPKKTAPKPGDYQFRLDVCSVAVTDEGDSSQAITFTVPEAKHEETHFPMWLIPVLAVALIGIGVGLFFALRPKGIAVPDLSGKNVTEATTLLADAGLTLASDVDTKESKPEDSGKITDQTPNAGEKAPKGGSVHVTVGANMVSVPGLVGHPYQEALKKLTGVNLAPGDTKTAPNPNFAGGVVLDQSPKEGQVIKAGTQVSLQVTPQTVEVKPVIGQTLAGAIGILRAANLDVGNLSGNVGTAVVSQNPASGSVPVGTKVDLVFANVGICLTTRCVYQGNVAKTMVLEKSRLAHW